MASVSKDPRGNGSWLAYWRDPSGKQHKKSFARKADAQRWLDQLQAELHRGRYIDPSGGKAFVAACAKGWLENLTHLKPSTLERYKGIVNAHILPIWGNWQIGKVASGDVNRWITTLVADGFRPGSVRQIHRVLSLIFDTAIRDGRLGQNPARGVKLPRHVRQEPMYLSAEQVSGLASAAHSNGLIILTLAFTGIRFGELAALKSRRFDAQRRRLNIVESVTEVGSQLVWTTPKTHQTRSVPVPPTLAGLLEQRCKGKQPDDLIFTSPLGKTVRLSNWRKTVFDPAVSAAGLTGLRPHDLRHTAASLAIQSGANVKVVQQMLGHASAAMTLDVYAGLFSDDLDSVADRLDALVTQMHHVGDDNVVELDAVRVKKQALTRQNTSVGPVGLEPTTYGEVGVHRLPWVLPVAKRALPGSERATCD
jgi:integrase